MKTNFFLLTVLTAFLCLSTIPEIQAQSLKNLKSAIGKKKKKKGGEKNESSASSKTPSPANAKIVINADDGTKSEQLAKEYSELIEGYEMKGITVYYLPEMLTESFEKSQKELTVLTSKPLDTFYKKNKEDIDRFLEMGEKLMTNPAAFDNKFDADAKMKYWKTQDSYNNNKGFKAHEWYTKNSGDEYLSLWTAYWEEKGEGSNAYETGLKDALDYAIELAYKEKDKDRPNVIKMMAAANKTLETFKQLLPEGNTMVATIEKDVKATLKEVGGDYLTNLFVNDFHKANTGKIFFSKTPINPETANESSFTNDFTVNDEIYAIAYFDATLMDLEIIKEENDGYDEATKTYKKKSVFNKYSNIKVDGSASMMQFVVGDWGEMGKQGYLTFALKPSLENADNQGAIEKFAKVIADKSPRTHEIPVEFYFRSANSSGALTINLGGMNKEQILAEADKAIEKANTELESSKISARGLPEWFSDASLYSHSFKPVSYAQVKALITKNLKAGYGAATIDALVVQDGSQNKSTWEVKVNALGVPLSRSGPGYHVAYTGTDGNCYHYYFYIFQKYQGNNTYGPTTNGTPSGITPTQYNCDNKKFAK